SHNVSDTYYQAASIFMRHAQEQSGYHIAFAELDEQLAKAAFKRGHIEEALVTAQRALDFRYGFGQENGWSDSTLELSGSALAAGEYARGVEWRIDALRNRAAKLDARAQRWASEVKTFLSADVASLGTTSNLVTVSGLLRDSAAVPLD